MSRLVLSQITIKKERSINSTTWYYLLQPSNASAPDSTNYGNPPPIYSDTGYSGWSTTEPTYTVGDDRVLYTMVQTLYSDNTFSYSTPTISSSYEAAKDAYSEAVQAEQDILELQELGLASGYIWDNMTYVAPTSTIPVYPIGSYIASGTLVNGSRTITRSNSNTYGLNTWISTGGINLRYNAIDLMKLTTSNLEFYYPSTSSQGTKAISLGTNGAINSLVFYGFNNSNKTMELTNNALNFYNPADGSTLLSSLTRNGLILSKGGIVVGSYNSSTSDANQNFVYLSSEDYGTGIQIGNSPSDKTDWRQIIGNKFGVDKAGNLYAAGANIEGAITATQLTISGGGATYDGASAINANGYTIEIIEDKTAAPTSSIITENQTYLYPVMYLNGEAVTTGITKTNYIWYTNENTATTGGVAGDSTNGGIIATYGNTYRVTYNLSDDAVGTAPSQQTIYTSDARHITDIGSSGITIHPEDGTAGNYMQLDSDGLKIYKSSTLLANYGTTVTIGNSSAKNVYIDSNGVQIRDGSISLANFGTTAQIGQSGSSRFLMNSDSLQAYNSSNVKYFEVNANGLSWGSNTAATTTQVNAAAQIASNYITDLTDGGIRIHPVNNENNSIVINSDGMEVFKGGSTSEHSMAFYGETARIGNTEDNHIIMSSTDGIVLKQQSRTLASFNSDEIIIGDPDVQTDDYMVIGNESIEMRYNMAYDTYSYMALRRSSGTVTEDIRDRSTTETWSKALIYEPIQTTQITFIINRGTAGYYPCYFTVGTAKTGDYNISYDGDRTFTYTYPPLEEGEERVDPQYSFYSIKYHTMILGEGGYGGYIQVGDRGLGSLNLSNTATFGKELITDSANQVATGRFNLVRNSNGDSLNYAFMVGNGSSGINRSNALSVDWSGNVDIASGAEYRINGKSITSQPIKVVQYGWVASPALSERTRVLSRANPANSFNSSDEPSSSEYTFVAWILFASNGWVGALYPSAPTSRTTDIWTATVKAATTGVSIYGTALYVRNDLL